MTRQAPGPGLVLDDDVSRRYGTDIAGLIRRTTFSGGELDLKAQIEEMRRRAQQRQERKSGPGLALDVLDDEVGEIELATSGIESRTDRLIGEAEALIAGHEYLQALEKLEEALAGSPGHVFALLLKGECLLPIEGMALAAIETVQPLRETALKPRLARRLSRLLADLRQALVPEMLESFTAALGAGGPVAAVRRMERYEKAEPTLEDVYFLSGACWMMAGDLDAALAEVTKGRWACAPRECPRLDSLARHVALQRVMAAMVESVEKVKQGAYKQAVDGLRKHRKSVTGVDLYDDLYGFVKSVRSAGGFKERDHVPAGINRERRTNLECFVIGREAEEARNWIDRRAFDQAEKVLRQALTYVPGAGFLHFMLAFSIFVGLSEASRRSGGVSAEEVESRLRSAAEHVEKAVADPDITAARDLEKAIGRNLAAAAEQRRYEPLFRTFNTTMENVQRRGGVRSLGDLKELKATMTKLRRRVRDALGSASADSRSSLQRLDAAISAVLAQIPL